MRRAGADRNDSDDAGALLTDDFQKTDDSSDGGAPLDPLWSLALKGVYSSACGNALAYGGVRRPEDILRYYPDRNASLPMRDMEHIAGNKPSDDSEMAR